MSILKKFTIKGSGNRSFYFGYNEGVLGGFIIVEETKISRGFIPQEHLADPRFGGQKGLIVIEVELGDTSNQCTVDVFAEDEHEARTMYMEWAHAAYGYEPYEQD